MICSRLCMVAISCVFASYSRYVTMCLSEFLNQFLCELHTNFTTAKQIKTTKWRFCNKYLYCPIIAPLLSRWIKWINKSHITVRSTLRPFQKNSIFTCTVIVGFRSISIKPMDEWKHRESWLAGNTMHLTLVQPAFLARSRNSTKSDFPTPIFRWRGSTPTVTERRGTKKENNV